MHTTIQDNLTFVRGDDIEHVWTFTDRSDFYGSEIKFGAGYGRFEKLCEVLSANSFKLTLTKEETAEMRGKLKYDIQWKGAQQGNPVNTLVRGRLEIVETQTDVPVNQPIDIGWVG